MAESPPPEPPTGAAENAADVSPNASASASANPSGNGSAASDLVAEFRRKAGPIVAQARGLTSAARIKLVDVARQVGLPEDQIDDALRTLAAGPATGTAPPRSKAADKFRRRLLKDLSGSEKSILGPAHEARIVAAGREKYGLDEATSLAMLAEAAAEAGLHRIRGDEATRNLATAVEDALGDQTWIATDARDRLYAAGKTWGLSQDVVDELIDERLAANSIAAARGAKRNRLLFVGVTVATIVALSVVIVLVLRGDHTEPEPPANSALTTPAGDDRQAEVAPPK